MVRHHCDFSSELLLHDPQSATKLLIHYPQMGLFQRIKQLAPLPFPPIKVGVSVTGIVYSDTTLLGGGGGGKASFSPFEVGKTSQRPSKAVQLILSPIEVMIGLALFLARVFSNNHKPRRCKK